MIHARNDYNRIQDPENKIAEDEPVFLLRAKDVFAPDVIDFWAKLVHSAGDVELANHVRNHADKMRRWQKENTCKFPNSPEVGKGKKK